MRQTLPNAAFFLLNLAVITTASAQVSPGPLLGTWTNENPSTKHLVSLNISASGNRISVEAFGACSPSPCVWGAVEGIAHADNVSSHSAVGFHAQYKTSFSQTILVGHLDGQFLEIETFTEFLDRSGRSNLYTKDRMARSGENQR